MEYSKLCTQAGDLQYKIRQQQKDLEATNDALRDLNREYTVAAAHAAKEAKAKEEADAKAAAEQPDNVTPLKKEQEKSDA